MPRSDPAARRVENRIPSSDANPYLALAASLACGLIGMINKVEARRSRSATTANEDEIDLPRGLLEAVDLFEGDEDLREMLGAAFVATYAAIKRAEFETFMEVISPWEREFLLLERVSARLHVNRPVHPFDPCTCARPVPDLARLFLVRGHRRRAPGLSGAGRRSSTPTSPSSAAASPVCRRRRISPRPASMSC